MLPTDEPLVKSPLSELSSPMSDSTASLTAQSSHASHRRERPPFRHLPPTTLRRRSSPPNARISDPRHRGVAQPRRGPTSGPSSREGSASAPTSPPPRCRSAAPYTHRRYRREPQRTWGNPVSTKYGSASCMGMRRRMATTDTWPTPPSADSRAPAARRAAANHTTMSAA